MLTLIPAIAAAVGLVVLVMAPARGELGAALLLGGLCWIAAYHLLRAPRAVAVLAFLSVAACVMLPLLVFVLWPAVLVFGGAAVFYWTRGAYATARREISPR